MPVQLVAEQALRVGEPLIVEGPSPSSPFLTVFEDDAQTGYFYGLDTSRPDRKILDAMHVYDVEQVTDRDRPSVVRIVWSTDGLKSALLINGYPHAVFDFEARRGYCRSNFPPPGPDWTSHGHEWDDAAIELFR